MDNRTEPAQSDSRDTYEAVQINDGDIVIYDRTSPSKAWIQSDYVVTPKN